MNRCLRSTLALGVVLLAAPAGAENSAPFADFSKLSKLEQIEPSRNELRCGGEFYAETIMSASPDQTLDYLGFLTVNGLPRAPYTLTLSPGDITVRERIHWPINVSGKSVNIRFRLIVIGKETKSGFQIAEISKDYNLGKEYRGKYIGC